MVRVTQGLSNFQDRRDKLTVEEMQNSPNRWLTPADVAEVLETDANTIRRQAQTNPELLGFPVVVLCSRVKILRKGFLEFIGE